MAITVGRTLRDDNFKQSVSLPSGAGSSLSTAFDLVGATLDANSTFPENVELEVTIPADTALVSAATRTYAVWADSANPPTTALSPRMDFTVTGTAGNGAASVQRFKLPASVARYVGIKISGGTSGSGDSTALSATVRLLF